MISENLKFIPISDGSRVFEDCRSLKMKFDIKDVEGFLAIKGYVNWAASVLDSSLWYEKQLCNLIQLFLKYVGFIIFYILIRLITMSYNMQCI